MDIAIWIAISFTCFLLPAIALTNGGHNAPTPKALKKYAGTTGLPLTDEVAGPLSDRIRRRERGTATGGFIGLGLGTLLAYMSDNPNQYAPMLIFGLTAAGTAFGGAWMLAMYRPPKRSTTPVVARTRSTRISDYLTKGERFSFFGAPVALLISVGLGYALTSMLPEEIRGPGFMVGVTAVLIALATWWIAAPLMFKVISAPSRSGTDLELAWDDAERALGLRRLADLVIIVACIAVSLWLFIIADSLTTDGFYRAPETQSDAWVFAGLSLLLFGGMILALVAGPFGAWLNGSRRGYEQRRLWGENREPLENAE